MYDLANQEEEKKIVNKSRLFLLNIEITQFKVPGRDNVMFYLLCKIIMLHMGFGINYLIIAILK